MGCCHKNRKKKINYQNKHKQNILSSKSNEEFKIIEIKIDKSIIEKNSKEKKKEENKEKQEEKEEKEVKKKEEKEEEQQQEKQEKNNEEIKEEKEEKINVENEENEEKQEEKEEQLEKQEKNNEENEEEKNTENEEEKLTNKNSFDKVELKIELYPENLPIDKLEKKSIKNILSKETLALSLDENKDLAFLGSNVPLLYGFYASHCDHYPIRIKPDDIWLLIVQAFSHHVNANSEELRIFC